MNTETKICQNCKNPFIIEPADFAFYEKMHVPPPTWCPECRMIRRMVWRNERALCKRACDLCHASTFSMYPQNAPFPVYCRHCYFSDAWDPLVFGKPYDVTRPFLSQWHELFLHVPQTALVHYDTNVECEFTNYIRNAKHTCLAYSVVNSDNIAYASNVDDSTDIFDCANISKCERCYSCMNCDRCYQCQYCFQNRQCLNSFFLYNCVNCQDCFMSSNLRNRKYVWKGKQLSKDEYRSRLGGLDTGSGVAVEQLKQEFSVLVKKSLHKFADLYKTTDSNGDALGNTKNAQQTFYAYDMENVKYIVRSFGTKDSMDAYSAGGGNQLVYEGMAAGHSSYGIKFYSYAHNTRDSEYSNWCHNCTQCFGCVGVRNKQYCILNKQYTREEYEVLVAKIIQHMNKMPYVDAKGRVYRYGEFFPPELSPFAYNETIAQEYFPLTKERALEKGYRWKDAEERHIAITLSPDNLPDHIKDVQDSITQEIIQCQHTERPASIVSNSMELDTQVQSICNEQCTTAFKIIPQELAFYRKMNLPLPRLCPNCRHYARLRQRNPLKLWKRRCQCDGIRSAHPSTSHSTLRVSDPMGSRNIYQNTASHFHGSSPCPNEFETSYAPERAEVVYCESCYNAEVA